MEFNNTGLEGEIRAKDQELAVLRQRHVPLLENEEKNYGMTSIVKNDESAAYPFISTCSQHDYRRQKKRMVLLKNPRKTEFADGVYTERHCDVQHVARTLFDQDRS